MAHVLCALSRLKEVELSFPINYGECAAYSIENESGIFLFYAYCVFEIYKTKGSIYSQVFSG